MLLKAAPGRAGLMLLKGKASPRVMLNARGLSELWLDLRLEDCLSKNRLASLASRVHLFARFSLAAKSNKNFISLGHELLNASFYDAQSDCS